MFPISKKHGGVWAMALMFPEEINNMKEVLKCDVDAHAHTHTQLISVTCYYVIM